MLLRQFSIFLLRTRQLERVFKMCYESRERSWEPLSVLLPDSGEEHARHSRIHSRIGVNT